MRSTTLDAAFGAALLALLGAPACASAASAFHHSHNHHHLLHRHSHRAVDLPKRNSNEHVHVRTNAACPFPNDPSVVAVTPGSMNAGWALSPDQECKPGMYCPYACKPGFVMAQWKPNSIYVYPESMDGGLLCKGGGVVEKPFPSQPLCVPGTGALKAVNKSPGVVSFCQTVLPGCESMIIPNDVSDSLTLAIPDISYWAKTSAQ
jgi:hypothetical protein